LARFEAVILGVTFAYLDEAEQVPLPALTLGLVVRYEYLWYRRSGTSGVADKDHPARDTNRHRQRMRRVSNFLPA
jgi:hypothetical protein